MKEIISQPDWVDDDQLYEEMGGLKKRKKIVEKYRQQGHSP